MQTSRSPRLGARPARPGGRSFGPRTGTGWLGGRASRPTPLASVDVGTSGWAVRSSWRSGPVRPSVSYGGARKAPPSARRRRSARSSRACHRGGGDVGAVLAAPAASPVVGVSPVDGALQHRAQLDDARDLERIERLRLVRDPRAGRRSRSSPRHAHRARRCRGPRTGRASDPRSTIRSSSLAPSVEARITDSPPLRSSPSTGVCPNARLATNSAPATEMNPSSDAQNLERFTSFRILSARCRRLLLGGSGVVRGDRAVVGPFLDRRVGEPDLHVVVDLEPELVVLAPVMNP